MTAEASARARGNVRRGKTAEQAVARYLRDFWPGAVRGVRTGSSAAPDPGDIAGVPFIVSVKDAATDRWVVWWGEMDAMLAADPGALGFIVQKRRGQAWPAEWWAHVRLNDLVGLHSGVSSTQRHALADAHVRLRLGDLVQVLAAAGYVR